MLPKVVSISGAVSPKTLEIESKIPVIKPLKPEGIITFKMILWYGTPKAAPASFIEIGIIFIVSSVERIINGNIMIANATLPAKAENPFVTPCTIQI